LFIINFRVPVENCLVVIRDHLCSETDAAGRLLVKQLVVHSFQTVYDHPWTMYV